MKRARIVDGWVTAFHLALAMAVALSYVTSANKGLVLWHTAVGVFVAALVVFRLAWGLWGTEAARFRTFVRGPGAVIAHVRALAKGKAELGPWHGPLFGAMVVGLLAYVFAVVVTGALVFAGPEWAGALSATIPYPTAVKIHELHTLLAWIFPGVIVFHLLSIAVWLNVDKREVITRTSLGYQDAPEDLRSIAKAAVRALATVALAFASAFGITKLFAVFITSI